MYPSSPFRFHHCMIFLCSCVNLRINVSWLEWRVENTSYKKYLLLLLTKNIGFTSLKSRHTFSNTILYIRYMLSWKSVASVCREHVCLLPTRCSKNCCTVSCYSLEKGTVKQNDVVSMHGVSMNHRRRKMDICISH